MSSEINEVDSGRWLLMLPSELVQRDLAEESEGIYFHMWRTRQEPWSALKEGDTVYVVDRRTRRITWELRARHVRRTRYDSIDEALTTIRAAFGYFPEDLSDYILTRPTEGFLLGWATEVVAAIDTVLPRDVNFRRLGGQHGYLPWSRLPPTARSQLNLPSPGRPALAEPAAWMMGDEDLGAPPPVIGRYIPAAVRRAVWQRDGGRCTTCGSSDRLHFDHIWPVSKGGGNELENIQLLCQQHNLEKAARIISQARPPAGVDLLGSLAAELAVEDPRLNLVALVDAALADGRAADAASALLEELDVTEEPLGLLEPYQRLGAEVPRVELGRARLAELVATNNPDVAISLAQDLLHSDDPNVRGTASLAVALADSTLDTPARRALYEVAATTEDQWVCGFAHLYLAELEDDADAAEAHLNRAAHSVHPTPRSIASFHLGRNSEDANEARAWFRRALITEDHTLFAECAVELALLHQGESACAYARWAIQSGDEDVVALAHLILGLERCDEETTMHLEQALKSTDQAVRREARAALRTV